MNQQPTITEQPIEKSRKNHKGVKIFGIIILSLLAIGGTGYSVYAWQQNVRLANDLTQKEESNKELSDENAVLKGIAKDTLDEETPVLSDQELAQKAAQNFVDAEVLDTKYIATPPKIKGDFASSGVAPAERPDHVVGGLLLKRVNGDWVVIHHGQNGPDQDAITRFAIPKEFRS